MMRDASAEARFGALVREHADALRRFLARRTNPDTADDVLADTLLVAWRRLADVPPEPLPWLYGVARRTLANAERAARRRDRLAARIAFSDPPQATAPDPADASDGEEVRAAIARLRPADAEVLGLWAWEGLEAAAIGVALGISANAAAIRLHRAKARLRDALGKNAIAAGHIEGEGRNA